ncbi:MAG: hypothetical protein J5634_01125 [Bacilli bacterium]|nr:hypothetical protein [Bacilli bacterium]
MLTIKNEADIPKMKNYYRASDMLDFWQFFSNSSPLEDLAIVFDEEDYLNNKDYLDSFDSYRLDTIKPYTLISGIESDGGKTNFLELFKKIKKISKHSVILFFDLKGEPTKRYMRHAGISVSVNMYSDICIEAVGKGFDGREISKGICVHERYVIPWFNLRDLNISNFHSYNIFMIDQNDYQKSRLKRIEYLLSLGLKKEEFINYIPIVYKPIPDFIWDDLIKNVLFYIEKNEEILTNCGYKHFCINGNTEGSECFLIQMYNKDRY